LTRAWQILLQGIGEVQAASQPLAAAEMGLIRLAYAAELPPPADLIKQLREQAVSAREAQVSLSQTPSGGGNVAQFSPKGGGLAVARAAFVAPSPVVQSGTLALPAIKEALSPMPRDFREMVALFATNREGGLYAELRGYAHPVRFAAGRVELRLEKKASPQLIPRAQQCLSDWTGRRWMIALVDEAGGPTLQEEDREIERQRQERAKAHPLMQAAFQAFPEAKLVSLKKKDVPPPVVSGEDEAGEEIIEPQEDSE
jgi:DNA polymerase-3 subunit gamma/tau